MTLKKILSIFLLFTLLCGALQMLPLALHDGLYYHAEQMPSALYYLWLTPHLLHLSTVHYLVNILSLGVVLFTFRSVFTPLGFFLLFGFSGLMVTLGLWSFSPDVDEYAGMSGVIYGLLSAGLLRSAKTYPFLSWSVLSLIAGKTVYEQFDGPHLSIQNRLGEVVIVDAHLYGFVAGLIFVLFARFLHKLFPLARAYK
ncbi:MAG: rhombosortase [Sulfurovum sp.]|nr:rhombosortase [Sulfurovum sp.]